MALFNFLGLVVFSAAEIWASLSERSANLRPTPADGAVLDVLGLHGAPISPTVARSNPPPAKVVTLCWLSSPVPAVALAAARTARSEPSADPRSLYINVP